MSNLKRIGETNQLLIQIARLGDTRPEGVENLQETILLDAEDGRVVGRTMAPYLYEVGPDHAITITARTVVNLFRLDGE